MSPATAEQAMAKRNDVSVKVDVEVIADARIAAAYKGMPLAEYLSESLRPIVARDIEEGHAAKAAKAAGKGKRKPKGGEG
jgi:hypothetical protein